MAIIVEHEKRRKHILATALDVFVEEGFEDATYQKIAGRCGITRTILYTYFRNKREIFNYSIKQLLSGVECDIRSVQEDAGLSYPGKIKKTLSLILNRLEANKRLLSVILDYLCSLSRAENFPERGASLADTRVRRRTIRLRHILANMIIGGMKAGEIKPVEVAAVNDLFYALIETAIFRIAVLKRDTAAELNKAVEVTVKELAVGVRER